MMAISLALIGEAVPNEKSGSAMGVLGTTSAVGTALGPMLGGALIAGLGWQAVFLVNLPLGILAFLLARRHLPADRPGPTAGLADFDRLGTLWLALTLVAYALAMTAGPAGFGTPEAFLLMATLLAWIIREAGCEGRRRWSGSRFGCVVVRDQHRSWRSVRGCGLRVLGLRLKGLGGACAPVFS